MHLPDNFSQYKYSSDQEIVDDILKDEIHTNRALIFLEYRYKDSTMKPLFSRGIDRWTLEEIFYDCLLIFRDVVMAGKFQVRSEGCIRRYVFTLMKHETNHWLKRGSTKGHIKNDVETRKVPSQEYAEREHEKMEFDFFENLRTTSRNKIRELLFEMGKPCAQLLAKKFGIPPDMLGEKETTLLQVSRVRLEEIAEMEERILTDKEVASLMGEKEGVVAKRKQRCLDKLFVKMVRHPDPAIKDILLRQAGKYAPMLDSYWELLPIIIQYENDKKRLSKILTVEQIREYEQKKEKDPRLRVFEELVRAWIPTRIENEDAFIETSQCTSEDFIEIQFSVSGRKQKLKNLKMTIETYSNNQNL